MQPHFDDPRLRKLRFRAWRRGFREADLILGPFADARVAAMDSGQLDRFEALLEVPDADLYGWIVGTHTASPEFDHDILQQIRDFRAHVFEPGVVRGG